MEMLFKHLLCARLRDSERLRLLWVMISKSKDIMTRNIFLVLGGTKITFRLVSKRYYSIVSESRRAMLGPTVLVGS